MYTVFSLWLESVPRLEGGLRLRVCVGGWGGGEGGARRRRRPVAEDVWMYVERAQSEGKGNLFTFYSDAPKKPSA